MSHYDVALEYSHAKRATFPVAMVISVLLHLAIMFGIAFDLHNKIKRQTAKPLRIEFIGSPPSKVAEPKEVEALAESNQQAAGQTAPVTQAPTTPWVAPVQTTITPNQPAMPRLELPAQTAPPPQPMAKPRPKAELTSVPLESSKKHPEPALIAPKEVNPVGLQLTPTLGEMAAWDQHLQENARHQTKDSDGAVDINTRQVKYAAYFRGIKQRIEQVWTYPYQAKKTRQTGNLLLEFTIDQEGNMVQIELLRSSGTDLLDDAAIKAIRKAGPFPPLPVDWKREKLRVKVTFEYLMHQLQMER